MKSAKRAAALLGLCISILTVSSGCSKSDVDHPDMGVIPMQPPGGNPYAPGTVGGKMLSPEAQKDFVTKLAALPRSQRPAFIRDHGTTMTAIQAGPDSPEKQKLTEILNQR